MGAVVICAQAIYTSMEVLQVNFLVILEMKKKKIRFSSVLASMVKKIKSSSANMIGNELNFGVYSVNKYLFSIYNLFYYYSRLLISLFSKCFLIYYVQTPFLFF